MFKLKFGNKLARLAAVSSILAVLGTTMVLPTAYAQLTQLGELDGSYVCTNDFGLSLGYVDYTNGVVNCGPKGHRQQISIDGACAYEYGPHAIYSSNDGECVDGISGS